MHFRIKEILLGSHRCHHNFAFLTKLELAFYQGKKERIICVPSLVQVVDVFTKGLPQSSFEVLVNKPRIINIYLPARVGVLNDKPRQICESIQIQKSLKIQQIWTDSTNMDTTVVSDFINQRSTHICPNTTICFYLFPNFM